MRFKQKDVIKKLKNVYSGYPELLEGIAFTLSTTTRFRSIKSIAMAISKETQIFLNGHKVEQDKVLCLLDKIWSATEALLLNQDQKYILMAYRNHLRREEEKNKWKSRPKS